MTRSEFSAQLLPALMGMWPKMVARLPRNPSELDRTVASEANRLIWDLLGGFEVNAVVAAARAFKREHVSYPEKKGKDWVLEQIRRRMLGSTRKFNPSAWNWNDEHELWMYFGVMAPLVVSGKRDESWLDEGNIARRHCGKNPTADEREYAYGILVDHIDKSLEARHYTEMGIPWKPREWAEWYLAKLRESRQRQAEIDSLMEMVGGF
jgi:hypothetical protein